jgi:hypothetical protein
MSVKTDASIPFRRFIGESLSLAFKTRLLAMTPDELQEIVYRIFPQYDVINADLLIEFNLLLIIYGFLSYHLHNKGICKLMIKGGKVLQQWHPIASNDIDVMLVPIVGGHMISDDHFIAIGQDICNFIEWIITGSFNWSIQNKLEPMSVKSIYKVSKSTDVGFMPLSDIGVGFNYLNEEFVKPLYLEETDSKLDAIGDINIQYFTLSKDSFINEKVYYAIYYYIENSKIHTYDYATNGGFISLEFRMNNAFIWKALQQLTAIGILDVEKRGELEKIVENVLKFIKTDIEFKKIMPLFEISYPGMNAISTAEKESYTLKRTLKNNVAKGIQKRRKTQRNKNKSKNKSKNKRQRNKKQK